MTGSVIVRASSTNGARDILAGLEAEDQEAIRALVPLVYDELRRLARHHLSRERSHQTLESTALIHEVYLRLAGQQLRVSIRSHFLAVAAQLMRQILVDYARRHKDGKRGGSSCMVVLDEQVALGRIRGVDVLALHNALKDLSRLHPRQSQTAELRFFGGLSIEDVAEVVGISPAAVKRDWATAHQWIYRQIGRTDDRLVSSVADAYSSRNSFAGSSASARCAGIQVATRPVSAMAKTTPVSTSGSRGVAW